MEGAEITLSKPPIMQRLGIAFLTWRRYLQKRLAPYDVTLKQMFVLDQLAKKDFLLPSQIARMLFCDRPTATVIVRNLEKRGWVERQRDAGDRRRKRVLLTAQGKKKLTEIQGSFWQAVESSLDPLACFSQEEREELDRLLKVLNKHLAQIREDAPGEY